MNKIIKFILYLLECWFVGIIVCLFSIIALAVGIIFGLAIYHIYDYVSNNIFQYGLYLLCGSVVGTIIGFISVKLNLLDPTGENNESSDYRLIG